MANHFARFGFEPRPWLDHDLLKQRFFDLSSEAHPDKAPAENKAGSEEDFKSLNESFNILRNTRPRLLHLLELCGLPKQEHVQNVPPDALECFAEVAAANNQADALIKQKAAVNSPMLKVQLMDQTLEQIDTLQTLQQNLRQRISTTEERLKTASQEWQSPPDAGTIQMLAQSAAALGFLERWHAQLQERIASLTF